MNMLAYEADTSWNRRTTCIFFKTLIQSYLLRSFFYSLTYCIKEVIKSNIFWRLNEKVLAYEAATARNRGIPWIFFKTLIQLYLFLISLFLKYCIKEGIKGNILDVKFKSVDLWGRYGLKQGNPLQNIKITNQIVFVLSPDLLFYFMYQKGYQR